MARKKKHEEHGAGERWAVPYADFLSLLLALFIALFAISTIDKKKLASFVEAISAAFSFKPISTSAPPSIIEGIGVKKSKSEEKKKLKEKAEKIIKQLGLEGKVSVEYVPEGVKIKILDYILFDSCSAVIKPEYKNLLEQLAKAFKEFSYPISVEGHTDNIPPSEGCIYPSNWELSAARAAAVARFLIESGKIDPKLFVVSGYADTRPLVPNTTPQGRAMNRRIEITIITGTDKEPQLEELKQKEVNKNEGNKSD